ncbi:hypothetical protein [Streptomyces sp. GMR22]|nr:hypothetical protein [Streptomyces sp. GMR22]MBA6439110.1 hypothetical protein [Streptomyces sp. GMR22]
MDVAKIDPAASTWSVAMASTMPSRPSPPITKNSPCAARTVPGIVIG